MLPMHQFGQAGAHRVTPTFHLALEPQPFTLQLNTKSLLAKLKKKKKKKLHFVHLAIQNRFTAS